MAIQSRTGWLVPLPEATIKLLGTGENTLAVHCHQESGGPYVDAGLVLFSLPPSETGKPTK